MNVITISREFHAGGGEVGRQLAHLLQWQLLDRELLHKAALVEHVPDAFLASLDEQAVCFTDRWTPHPTYEHYIHGLSAVARQAAARGNVILVGRGARFLLGYAPQFLHLRLVAPKEWRIRRAMQRKSITRSEAESLCLEVDRIRKRFHRFFFGRMALQPTEYDLVLNTGRVPLEDVAAGVAALIRSEWKPEAGVHAGGRRILTCARELGASNAHLVATLAKRLCLQACEAKAQEQHERANLNDAKRQHIYEQPPRFWQRLLSTRHSCRPVTDLAPHIRKKAMQGNVLLLDCSGHRLLQDVEGVFHVRLMATQDMRLLAVMRERELDEIDAHKLILADDRIRHRFYRYCFGADWSSPLEYHMSLNTGRLGTVAVELISFFAQRYWRRITHEHAATIDFTEGK